MNFFPRYPDDFRKRQLFDAAVAAGLLPGGKLSKKALDHLISDTEGRRHVLLARRKSFLPDDRYGVRRGDTKLYPVGSGIQNLNFHAIANEEAFAGATPQD